ncbi:induced myeloid leukemia cell differentiation protein Mcl-1 [Spea bombifrons]|uniref:induced myeloid leukemia cell differentiation protein Mcl-1 n=1 Tax=Spea bombifrons TaxID=233779 RepID=UPI00234AB8E8|nr:induced myeloid leukemia cell differentiation protein Mcl-1 [Spea bombifrons]
MSQPLMSLNRNVPIQLYFTGGALTSSGKNTGVLASPAAHPSFPAGLAAPMPMLPVVPRLPPLEKKRERCEEDEEGGAEVSPRPLLNGFGYKAGGSLPSSQEELEESDVEMEASSRGSTSPPDSPTCPKDNLYRDTQQLLVDYFREYAGAKKSSLVLASAGLRKAMDTLRRVGGDIIDKHQIAFQGMLTRISINSSQDVRKLSHVPNLVFNDGITNWGRIVTVISFGAFVAKHLKSMHLEDSIITLAESFTEFLMTSKREWIVQHKGWDGFVEFFHVEDYESGIRTVLMAFAGVAGLGASLAYMIR